MNSRTANTSGTCGTVLLLAAVILSGCISNGKGTRDLAIMEPLGVRAANSDSATLDFTTPVISAIDRSGDSQEDRNYNSQQPGEPVVISEETAFALQRSEEISSLHSLLDQEDQSGPAGIAEIVPETQPRGFGLIEQPQANLIAADLLDHWGHRRVQSIVEGLSLVTAEQEADAADLEGLITAAETAGMTPVVPDLQDGDDVRILGSRQGVTYGRWAGGPADSLSIDFNLSGAGALMRDDPGFQATLERAGKAWSRRIADTWIPWEREEGDLKGFLVKDVDPGIQVRVGEGGEISSGLDIDVRDEDLDGSNAWARRGVPWAGDTWQPRFGSIEVDREYLQETYEARLFSTLTHEIGHPLGAWAGAHRTEDYAPYTDAEAGTWEGPNVVAIHGDPAPFGEKTEAEFDFAHSGVCTSLMAYCRHDQAIRPLGPQTIDFAFLADLGMTITEETDRPETYGLAGWTDYVGFSISVSRDLRIDWATPQPLNKSDDYRWPELEFTDLLQVGVDAFGHGSTGNPRLSHAEEAPYGTARYVGGLIGAALYRPGLPPVTGDATLAIDLDSLDGQASFTSLLVHPDGEREIFGSGSLYYPFEVLDNSILGTDTHSTLNANFFGPEHDDVAGTLRDPRAGLLASFGATVDERPNWQSVIANANHMRGIARLQGSKDSGKDGWYLYRCGTDSACESTHYQSTGWTDWMAQDRGNVLAATAGWNWRNTARPDREFGFATVSRQHLATTDSSHGRHFVDGYLGTLEYVGFGAGIEVTSREWADPNGLPPAFEHLWVGFHGALSESPPDATATWSGRMIGYERWTVPEYQNPFVEGLATVTYSLADNEVNIAFSEILSRDGLREIDDFGYKSVPIESNGTFQEGKITGAFFGSSNQEVAGHFDNNSPRILGSFGARRLLGGAMLDQVEIDEALANIVETEDGFRIGTDVVPPDDRFTGQSDFNGATVSSFVLDENENILAEDMGPWNDYSFHLRGDLEFAGGAVAFGIAHGSELVEPWALGPTPLAYLADNSALSGTVGWNGALLGMGTSNKLVTGKAHLSVEISTLQGELYFTALEQWGDEPTLGEIGTGTIWGDGGLEYSISVQGNYFLRTNGDDGLVTGSFFGGSHQAAAGVLERSDLHAGFGGTR